jgi:ElaB/YqjD/DUF883 family membrane-anchored ribosome-binding protein
MGEGQSQVGTSVGNESKSPEELHREIEETREDLGETAAALAEKTDVKARAKEKVESVKQTVSDKKESVASGSASGPAADLKVKAKENPVATAALAAFAGGFLIGRITSR